ncbi:Putative Glycoside hydrolase family 16 [[Torrubiella] hemipterigena]|uniref:Putative Glycoside hydrolase family 16 n=1 Tax=[Torrubiella] hemipterigena TaxID=1531966 RepID=A0A0A1TKR0_9HYPO|nr:Putative Glycoside hydrolase family 16 [[Torrubiella] hemipterigena]
MSPGGGGSTPPAPTPKGHTTEAERQPLLAHNLHHLDYTDLRRNLVERPSIASLDAEESLLESPVLSRSEFLEKFAPVDPQHKKFSRRRMIVLVLGLCFVAFVYYVWRRELYLESPWLPDFESIEFSKKPLPEPLRRHLVSEYSLPLRTKGRDVVDAAGKRFKLHSVNWYGASDELFVPGGLDIQNRTTIAKTIKRLGFNSVRMPYADELVTTNPIISDHLVKANPDLAGLRALDVLEASVTALTDEGITVIMNNHITAATWCCGANPCDAGWSNDHLGSICPIRQTEEDWIRNWETVMVRYIHNPLVIGADLRNEVRGLWGTMPWKKWAAAAEKCGNRLLKMNPDWLIIVEGTESANDLTGVAKRPVQLDVDHRLVYSAHVYQWSGWGSKDGRFGQRNYESFKRTMRENWGYILEQDIAPVWVGELGAPHRPSVMDHTYWKHLWRYLKSIDADFGYWAINPRKPSGNAYESYSLVSDDWVTPVLDYRMKDMQDLIRLEQQN